MAFLTQVAYYYTKNEKSVKGQNAMEKLAALVGIFILAFGISIILCCILPSGALVFVEAILLIAAGVFFVLSL